MNASEHFHRGKNNLKNKNSQNNLMNDPRISSNESGQAPMQVFSEAYAAAVESLCASRWGMLAILRAVAAG